MTLNDATDRCQSDTVTLKLVGSMETLKGLKKFARVSHIKSGAVVSDEVLDAPGTVAAAKVNRGCRIMGCVFPGVFKEVLKRGS